MMLKKSGFHLSPTLTASLMILMAVGLSACGETEAVYPVERDRNINSTVPVWTNEAKEGGSIFGDRGIVIGGRNTDQDDGSSGTGMGINAFLWRASLDTVAFMPLASADPFGGVIITDWYSPPESPSERFKVNVFILDRTLRADGVKVSVFRQVLNRSNSWGEAPADAKMATDLENTILTRARQIRSVRGSGH